MQGTYLAQPHGQYTEAVVPGLTGLDYYALGGREDQGYAGAAYHMTLGSWHSPRT